MRTIGPFIIKSTKCLGFSRTCGNQIFSFHLWLRLLVHSYFCIFQDSLVLISMQFWMRQEFCYRPFPLIAMIIVVMGSNGCSIFRCEPNLGIQPLLVHFVGHKTSMLERIHFKMRETDLEGHFFKFFIESWRSKSIPIGFGVLADYPMK